VPNIGVTAVKRAFGCQNGDVRVLVVEDDAAIASSLTAGLTDAGFSVEHVSTGSAALAAGNYDVMLLDVGLPDIDGFDVCRRVRSTSSVPIIVLTARADEIDRVVGLESGADDYVPKPFSLRELIARIKAVTRRSAPAVADVELRRGPLVIDTGRRRVTLNGNEVVLTAKEFDLLEYLAREPDVVHRRIAIMEAVWDTEWYGSTKTLDAHVASVRKKLGDPRWIEAVRGVGFRLVVPE
jgi:two-component system response regulator RegX3